MQIPKHSPDHLKNKAEVPSSRMEYMHPSSPETLTSLLSS